MNNKPVRRFPFDWACLVLASALLGPLAAAAADIKGRHLGEIPITATPLVAARLQVSLFDANPKFLPEDYARALTRLGELRTLRGVPSMHETLRVEGKDTQRRGAVADGVSRLLIRVISTRPGAISFELDKALGSVEPAQVRTEPAPDGKSHWALALYTPPRGLPTGAGTPRTVRQTRTDRKGKEGKEREMNLDAVVAPLQVTWRGTGDERHAQSANLSLFRPPVVLVHGTYDSGTSCWDWTEDDTYVDKARKESAPAKSPYDTPSFARQLEDGGFAVFVVDYKRSNGQYLAPGGVPSLQGVVTTVIEEVGRRLGGAVEADPAPLHARSHFFHNAKVAWEGGRPDDPDRGEGIQAALQYFRDGLKVAATQADVVGHSMGGILARVYARGFALPDPDSPDTGGAVAQSGADWFRRADNLGKGDIFRLITIGSTHKGSDIPGVLSAYVKRSDARAPGTVGQVVWSIGDWKSDGKFSRGAFTDQIPGSRALRALGPTRVPAHAIAGVAKVRDLPKFQFPPEAADPTYRERMEAVWSKTPRDFLAAVFAEHSGRPDDGAAFRRMEQQLFELTMALGKVDTERGERMHAVGALTGGDRAEYERRIAVLEAERERLAKALAAHRERMLLRYVAAVFRNDWTDFTVSLDSALGGFAEGSRFATVLPRDYATAREGVLHGYEPRHEAVQKHVVTLLKGGMENFNPEGFPAYSPPAYFTPEQARFKAEQATCADMKPPSPLCP